MHGLAPASRWHGIAVESAAPGVSKSGAATAAEHHALGASTLRARNSDAPEAVQGIFQVGLTVPPQFPYAVHHPATVSEEHVL